jgi:acyl-CoA synthetase (NDP forming)
MAADLADEEGVDIPDDEELATWVGTLLPGTVVANPLDATGFAAFRHELFIELLEAYTKNPKFDAFVFFHQLAEWDTGADVIAKLFADHCRKTGRPAVISPMAGHGGRWLDQIRLDSEVAVGNGLRGSLRGFNTMSQFVRSRSNAHVKSATTVALVAKPQSAPVQSEVGEILSFEGTMELFSQMGIPVARYHIVGLGQVAQVPFSGPYVVKLADVAHRTELGAVRVDVSDDGLRATVEELQELAQQKGLPTTVAIQPFIKGFGEAFVGVRSSTELGPVVAFGIGGVFVEVMHRVSGRLAPLSADDAQELISEFDDIGVLDGFRGSNAWDRIQLGQILVNAGTLAAASRSWVETIDINPLILGPEGLFAVDGLVVLKPGVA